MLLRNRVLFSFEYKYSYSHYGIDINTALQDYQDTSQIPEKVQGKVSQFYDAMDDCDYEKAKKILTELEWLTAPAHPTLIQMRTRYEFETMGIER